MQPAVEQPTDSVAQEDRRGNDETYFRVASSGDEGIGFGRAIWSFGILVSVSVFGHDEGDSTLTGGEWNAPSFARFALVWTADAAVPT